MKLFLALVTVLFSFQFSSADSICLKPRISSLPIGEQPGISVTYLDKSGVSYYYSEATVIKVTKELGRSNLIMYRLKNEAKFEIRFVNGLTPVDLVNNDFSKSLSLNAKQSTELGTNCYNIF
ncbi:MAG: hypothetical protein H7061_11880 [Bdellovibrionaceae bacterium]|nr:hypothetical protein [Bdellovibrio sp.]